MRELCNFFKKLYNSYMAKSIELSAHKNISVVAEYGQ